MLGAGISFGRGAAHRSATTGLPEGTTGLWSRSRRTITCCSIPTSRRPKGGSLRSSTCWNANPDVAVVSPKLISWTDRTKFEYAGASGGFIDFLGYPFCRGRILQTAWRRTEGQYDDARDVFWVSGAAFCCRADVFHALGGFDADFLRPHGGDRPLLAHAAGRLPGAGRAAKQGLPPRRRYAHRPIRRPKSSTTTAIIWRCSTSAPRPCSGSRLPSCVLRSTCWRPCPIWCRAAERQFPGGVPRLPRLPAVAPRSVPQAARPSAQNRKGSAEEKIYRGSVVLRYLLGRRTFGGMM